MLENPRAADVKRVARLSTRNERLETGLFLVEGPQAVLEALRMRPDLIEELYVTPTAWERHPELAEASRAAEVESEFASEEVIVAMSDTVTPQGVVAVCRQFPVSVRKIFDESVKLVAVLEEVRDPGNAGTIIRAADAAGADAVVLTGRSVDLYNPKVVRSTTGSLFHIPVAVGADLKDVVSRARAAGITVMAADVAGEDLLEARRAGTLAGATAWVFGNEARGLTADDLELVDRSLRVPIYGEAESMNLSTAASVCLYESAFAQQD